MTEYDVRQLGLMIEKLDAFDAIYLSHLVSDLDGLQSAMESADAQWKSAFLEHSGVLEDVNADILDENLTEFPNEHARLLTSAIQEMRKLIAQRL
ncbi:hypothetical protein [Bradyrhizobium neotropicale]|uniref:Uncharacterized protein n=1 Tax=Bradyrhizobium neotropicale TaxID=1497615 RepID=A0A176YLL1_9BRAD|nr:hypothetical protein [Bradyrhizobium neotropicale]OAF07471.1 hypothetical protein AXW67_30090 [Bradyrhizobium neotropicale]